jgi:tRNA (guanine10-N2)-methyltransferase
MMLLTIKRVTITYRRLTDAQVPESAIRERRGQVVGVSADDLNPFRKRYFEGFKP